MYPLLSLLMNDPRKGLARRAGRGAPLHCGISPRVTSAGGAKSVIAVMSAARPLPPQEQTFAGTHRTAGSCQLLTHASQQTKPLFDRTLACSSTLAPLASFSCWRGRGTAGPINGTRFVPRSGGYQTPILAYRKVKRKEEVI